MTTFVRDTGSFALDAVQEMPPHPIAPMDLRIESVIEVNAVPRPGYSGIEERSGPVHSFLEHSMLYSFPIVFGLSLYFSVNRLYELELLWWAILAIPIGHLSGDLVSGFVHWAADTYGTENTPVVGQSLIKPFRLHHLYPRDICVHNLVTTVGNTCIFAVPVLAFCVYLLWITEHGFLAFIILCTTLMALATVATNLFHKWAHQESPSKGIRLLQRMRLVLDPEHHQLHHTRPFDRHYCITNGWLNPLLNRIGFFRKLEAILRALGLERANAADREC
jgi:TMEM189-like protein